jgi:spore coat polysaccharide biosynthesis predicted glycosyltransferase SpsG
VRDAILAHRRDDGARFREQPPRVIAFMGGTDPGGVMVPVAESIAGAAPDIELTAITTEPLVDAVRLALSELPGATVMPPTRDLPALLGSADVVVSAAGTSAWDVCAIGRPAVLVAVAGNQVESLSRAVDDGLALGVDGTIPGGARRVGALLTDLLSDSGLRGRLVARSLETFDGAGKHRVVDALERGAP